MDIIPKLGFEVQQQPPQPQDTSQGKKHSIQIRKWENTEIQQAFNTKYPQLFARVGRVKHNMVRTRFMQNYKPFQQKGRRRPITIKPQVEEEINRLLREGHNEKLGTCTDDNFISPVVVTVKKMALAK